jgi:hypothetical protein
MWRRGVEPMHAHGIERIAFTDVPTDLVRSEEPTRLDWWSFPPWPNPTTLAHRHGLGSRYGPGVDATVQMLYEVREQPDTVIAVMLSASIIQVLAYLPTEWRGTSFRQIVELQSAIHDSGAMGDLRWFGTVRRTLPTQLFRDSTLWRPPTSVRMLVALLAAEHALLLGRFHLVRAVPLTSVRIAGAGIIG